MRIQENILLAPLTTFRIGGPAKYFVEIQNSAEAQQALRFARDGNLPVFILGGGSNILVSDAGFSGLVIRNNIRQLEVQNNGRRAVVRVGGGENWDEFVRWAVEMNLAGAENLAGIPGTVGAAPVQNIGAYGSEVGKIIASVSAIDIHSGLEREFAPAECAFGYRDSFFKSAAPGKFLITRVVFSLTPGGRPEVSSYPDLEKYFSGHSRPTLTEIRRAVIEIRARKGMVILDGYETYSSAGSFFKNPVVTVKEFESLYRFFERDTSSSWFWASGDGWVKISAARLIEASGFPRGHREGRVGISPKHSLAIINLGGATAAEVVNFVGKIKAAVEDKFGIRLEPEVQFVGF